MQITLCDLRAVSKLKNKKQLLFLRRIRCFQMDFEEPKSFRFLGFFYEFFTKKILLLPKNLV